MSRNFLYHFPYSVFWVIFSFIHLLRVRESAQTMVLYGFGNGVLWTFNEYLIHRFVLHRYMYPIYHKMHHLHWDQAIFSQQWFIFLGFSVYYQMITHLFGQPTTNRVFSFVPMYYVLFEWVHYVSHDAKTREPKHMISWIKHYHRLHHLDERCNYAITTPLWDWVFGTLHSDIVFGKDALSLDMVSGLVPLVWFIRAPLPDKKRSQDRLN